MIKVTALLTGDRVRLAGTGWEAEIKGSTRGHTTVCRVFGDYTEVGSVYTTDIVEAYIDHRWVPVEHTPDQVKAAAKRKEEGW